MYLLCFLWIRYTDVSITSPTIIRRKAPMAIGIPFVIFEGGIGGSVAVSEVDSNFGTTDE